MLKKITSSLLFALCCVVGIGSTPAFAQTTNYVVTTTEDSDDGDYSADDISLREAIKFANANADDSEITFDATVFATPQTITVGSTLPALSAKLTITGPAAGVAIDGVSDSFNIFTINSGVEAELAGLTVSNGLRGIINSGTAIVTGSTLSGNVYSIINSGTATVTVTDSTLSGNNTGIENSGTATVTVTNSTLSGNSFGIANDGTATVTVTNSTLSGNTYSIYNFSTATITNSTLSGNNTGIYNFSTVALQNSIVAGNTNRNILGTFTNNGNNLIDQNAKLGPLQDNGGPTFTMLPALDSPAIDAGNSDQAKDQRGVSRPQGEDDDIGAVEVQESDLPRDFGDAPDPSYPTLSDSDGARHVIVSGFSLGATVDAETNGAQSANADGDGGDEDGVTLPATLQAGQSANITVNLTNTAGVATPQLDAWIDFNSDGDWDDTGEQIASSLALTAGNNSLTVNVPEDAIGGQTFARFRLSSAGGLSPTGLANDGEVEDYTLTIQTNTAPVVSEISISTDEDVAYTFSAAVFDEKFSDADNDSLQFVGIASLPKSGVLRLDGVVVEAGDEIARGDLDTLVYTPNADFNGDDSFNYNASDGTAYADTNAKVKITVRPINDPPTIGDDKTIYGNEGQLITFFADGMDADSDAVLTYSLIGAPDGATINSSTGEFRWIPTEAQGPGTYTFQIKVTDGTSSAFQNVTIIVREVNAAPVLDLGGDRTVTGGVPFSFGITASDSDVPKQGLGVYPIAPTPSWVGLTNGPTLYGTAPVATSPYMVTIAVRAGDSFGAITDKSIRLTVVPVPTTPSVTWAVAPTWSATEGTLTYRLQNTTNKAITGIWTSGHLRVAPRSVSSSVGTTSWNSQGNGYFGVYWSGFNVAPGGEATLVVKVPRRAAGTPVAGTLYCNFGPNPRRTLATNGVNAP
jgi:CSLREA domain-containing protein